MSFFFVFHSQGAPRFCFVFNAAVPSHNCARCYLPHRRIDLLVLIVRMCGVHEDSQFEVALIYVFGLL